MDLSPHSLSAVFNLWIVTPLKITKGSPETIRKRRYLHYNSYQYQNYRYEVSTEIILWRVGTTAFPHANPLTVSAILDALPSFVPQREL